MKPDQFIGRSAGERQTPYVSTNLFCHTDLAGSKYKKIVRSSQITCEVMDRAPGTCDLLVNTFVPACAYQLASILLIFMSDLLDEKLEGERDRHRRHEHWNGPERKMSAD
jgi:hypothetical protein